MELGQAKAIVHNMKAKYDAFDKLEQAIAAVEQAQGLHNERAASLASLEAAISERLAELSELTNQANLARDKVTEMERTYARRSQELASGYERQRNETANRVKADEREADLARSALRDEVATLQAERQALQDNLASLRAQIAAIRQSLNISGT